MTRRPPSPLAVGRGESVVGQTPRFLGPIDLPPGATLWGFVMFRSDEAVEVVIAGGKESRVLVGEMAGPRVAEFSWRNNSAEAQQVQVRGRTVASNQELMISGFRGTGHESWVIGFGLRGSPHEAPDGRPAHEAVLATFVVYDNPPGAGG